MPFDWDPLKTDPIPEEEIEHEVVEEYDEDNYLNIEEKASKEVVLKPDGENVPHNTCIKIYVNMIKNIDDD